MATVETPVRPRTAQHLGPFVNEPFFNFRNEENARRMRAAIAKVRGQLGREYDLIIGGKRVKTADKIKSLNPSRPSQIVGIHQKAGKEHVEPAMSAALRAFESWSRTTVEERASLLFRAADLMRQRKMEYMAWLVFEVSKNWGEADADISETIDFCEFYAREALRFAKAETPVQLPGERDSLMYIPLGVGAVIPPWNFPCAIMAGLVAASLVTGNTVVLKPAGDSPAIAAQFVDILFEAGIPKEALNFITGPGSVIGDALVRHAKTRYIGFTGSKEVGLRISELAGKAVPGQMWIKRTVLEMGGKDAIVVDEEADLDAAAEGTAQAAFGYQGQKCSACSRAIVAEKVYDSFVQKLLERAKKITVGPSDDPNNYMGPVISETAMKGILNYIEVGKKEGKLVLGGGRAPGDGYFVQPTIIADVDPKARVAQEEIFGPVLAVIKARDFDHALEIANGTEFGLTGAVYSKNQAKLEKAEESFHVGNLYLNRKCTGAMVGAHPFGGFNMSGTDSKTGGKDYLHLFLQAKAIAEKVQ